MSVCGRFRGRLFTSLRRCAAPVPNMVRMVRGLGESNVGVNSAAKCAATVVSVILPNTTTRNCAASGYIASGGLPTKHPRPCVVCRGVVSLTVPSIRDMVGCNSAVTSVGRNIGTNM